MLQISCYVDFVINIFLKWFFPAKTFYDCLKKNVWPNFEIFDPAKVSARESFCFPK